MNTGKGDTPKGTDAPTTRRERRSAERAARGGGRASPAAGSRSSAAGSRSSVRLITGVGIVLGVLGVAALIIASSLGGSLPAVSAADAAPPPVELHHGRSLGDPDAPVKIDLIADPQCPACGAFTARIEPLLVAGPVRDGKVYLTYRDMAFLGDESIEAAAAMRVAEALGGKFWDFHDIVFANQHGENKGAFSRDRLADMAEVVGLERDGFLAAMDDAAYAQAVAAESEEARALGAASTPTLIIDGEVSAGVPSWEELRDRIDAAVAIAREVG